MGNEGILLFDGHPVKQELTDNGDCHKVEVFSATERPRSPLCGHMSENLFNNKSRFVYLMKIQYDCSSDLSCSRDVESQMLTVTFLQLCNMPIEALILKLYFC